MTTVKRVAVLFESDILTGRLFDVDVMAYHNEKQLSRQALGLPARQCLICDKDAKVCMKLGAHTLTEGYQVINQLYKKWPQHHYVSGHKRKQQLYNMRYLLFFMR
ncbi:citrate lyase holo-[acyl-carrier protein] synthase [Leuconostoc citreum]